MFRVSIIKSIFVIYNFKKYHILGHFVISDLTVVEFLNSRCIFCYKFFSETYSIFSFSFYFFKKKMKFFFGKRKRSGPRYDNSLHFGIFLIFLLPSVHKLSILENLLYINIGWNPLLSRANYIIHEKLVEIVICNLYFNE